MNIFVLDNDPAKAAILYCDKHFKIILEIAQMLCATYHTQGIGNVPYKLCHKNHPVTKWVGMSSSNFDWACEHAIRLTEEKIHRYGTGHKSLEVVKWAIDHKRLLYFDMVAQTPFAIAINNESKCRTDPSFNERDPVTCYQLYYRYDKVNIAKWTNRPIPHFMQSANPIN